MCARCGWLDRVADLRLSLTTRSLDDHQTHILASVADQIEANEHITDDQAAAIDEFLAGRDAR